MYRVADTKGGLKEERLLLIVYCIVSRLPRVFQVGGGIVKVIMYPFADTKGGLRGERVLLRVCCIASRIPSVV